VSQGYLKGFANSENMAKSVAAQSSAKVSYVITCYFCDE